MAYSCVLNAQDKATVLDYAFEKFSAGSQLCSTHYCLLSSVE